MTNETFKYMIKRSFALSWRDFMYYLLNLRGTE